MRAFSIILCLLCAGLPTARAKTFEWLGRGTIAFDVPSDWTIVGSPGGDVGFNFRGTPGSHAPVVLQISLINTPADHPVSEESIQTRLHHMVQSYIPGSVEKQFTPQPLKTRQGEGWYVQFTDASLVGKPSVPNNFKVMRNALIALDDHAIAVATMQFDDATDPEVAEMLALVSSMRFDRASIEK